MSSDPEQMRLLRAMADEMAHLRLESVHWPIWSPTPALRILERHYPSGDTRTKLQQLWRSDDGREHWRDVETVVEQVTDE